MLAIIKTRSKEFQNAASARMRTAGVGLTLLLTSVAFLTGCSGSMTPVKVGSVVFTDSTGTAKTAPTAMTAGTGSYVEVTVTGDTNLLGADWKVECGSALAVGTPLPVGQTQDESCGTFVPAHTVSGPIPSYATNPSSYLAYYTSPAAVPKQGVVTLYASSTSNPLEWSSVTLTINAQPISIEFAPPAPSTLAAGASTKLTAAVSNDTANGGVSWSVVCGSSDCGSFSSAKTATSIATTYTAPASMPTGGYVVVVATSVSDTNQSVSAKIEIQ